MTVNCNLHRPATAEAVDLPSTGGVLRMSDIDGNGASIFMPYPVALAMANLFNQSMQPPRGSDDTG